MKHFSIFSALLAGLLLCTNTVTAGGRRTVNFEPDTVTVLRNPLNGWVMYLGRTWDGDFWDVTQPPYDRMPTSEGTVVRVSDYANTAYIRTKWAMLEPSEGVYEWRNPDSRIYKLLHSCLDRGMKLAFRIVVDGRDQGQNTPMYVIDAGAEYYTDGGGNHKSPYPDDPVFQEKYSKFIKAFAEDFNDHRKVDFIDAFGLGKWGESHAMIYKDPSHKKEVFGWITDLYSSTFTQVPLVIHYHRLLADMNKDSWGPVSPDTEEMLQMAIDKGYSLRHDAFGMNGYYQEWEKEFAARWNFRRPIIMEGGWITAAHHRYWNDPCGEYREGHSEDVRRGEFEASREARVNMMDFRINDETRSWFTQSFDLVKRFVAEGGYRLYPDQVTMPEKARSGSSISVTHRWNNLGWGYCPNNIPQWNYRYKVAFALLDSSLKPVKVVVDPKAEPSEWILGKPVEYTTEISLDGVEKGTYSLALAIVDTSDSDRPAIEIALPREVISPEGWATISQIRIK
ncbi:MAG: DUF4832 domain-containing protein [Candidatus Cryptobacteroides sp.]